MNQAELRQTFNAISRNFESANETAQVGIYSFTQTYIDPCLSGFKDCLYDCTAPCFPSRDENSRRRGGRSRGRADFDFDFYDDWDAEEANGATGMGWANDELDSLLAGRGTGQPSRQRAMSYGARARKNDPDTNPTILPKSSYLGFLDRLPFRIGSRGLKYTPSASGLQENPGGLRIRDVEAEPLMEEYEDDQLDESRPHQSHRRQRSDTVASRSTTTTRSARSDLIMSDEEEDAVPLDDEFAVMLSRRNTVLSSEDHTSSKSGNTRSSKRPSTSRVSSRAVSSRSAQSIYGRKSSGTKSPKPSDMVSESDVTRPETPSMVDLKREEDQLREEEELEIMQKREAATILAQTTGLNVEAKPMVPVVMTEPKDVSPIPMTAEPLTRSASMRSPLSGLDTGEDIEPFPDVTSPTRSVEEPP